MNTHNPLNVKNQIANDSSTVHESGRAERVYHDISGLRPDVKDVLQQLNTNLRLLEDMTGRLGFVLSEVRGLIRR